MFIDDSRQNIEGAAAVGLLAKWLKPGESVESLLERVGFRLG
jgi:FMN phosphatase YigB (HAD superfamily)